MLSASAAVVLLLAAVAALSIALWKAQLGSRRLGERIRTRAAELEMLQQAFSRFAPHEIVEDIIERGVSTRSEKKVVTVLFADLEGFTSMSEKLDPAVLVEILNGYFREMSRAIESRRGHVSKLIGDGILALFGALEHDPWQVDDAVHAALDMRQRLAAYNEQLEARGRPRLSMGIGIHHGEVVAGIVGSDQITEYTVLGSVVNLASRVEGLTRRHPTDILVTEAVKTSLDERFRLSAILPEKVKGVSEPVPTWSVDGFDGGSD